jgi:hypothetical protein
LEGAERGTSVSYEYQVPDKARGQLEEARRVPFSRIRRAREGDMADEARIRWSDLAKEHARVDGLFAANVLPDVGEPEEVSRV